MTNDVFRNFRESLRQADRNADIWYALFLFTMTTRRQHDIIIDIIRSKTYCTPVIDHGKAGFRMPTGAVIFEQYQG